MGVGWLLDGMISSGNYSLFSTWKQHSITQISLSIYFLSWNLEIKLFYFIKTEAPPSLIHEFLISEFDHSCYIRHDLLRLSQKVLKNQLHLILPLRICYRLHKIYNYHIYSQHKNFMIKLVITSKATSFSKSISEMDKNFLLYINVEKALLTVGRFDLL